MDEIQKKIKKCIKESLNDDHHIISIILKYYFDEKIYSLPFKLANKYIVGTRDNNTAYIPPYKLSEINPKNNMKYRMNEIYKTINNRKKGSDNTIEFKPGYNFIFCHFKKWVDELIKFIKNYEDDLSFISLSLYENQGIGIETISNVILELLMHQNSNLISGYYSDITDLIEVIKKVYILINIPDYAAESSIDNLLSWFSDERILNDIYREDQSQLGQISQELWQKYVEIVYGKVKIDKVIIKWTNKDDFFIKKLNLKYNFKEDIAKKIYKDIRDIELLIEKDKRDMNLIVKYIYIRVLKILMGIKICYDKYDDIRGLFYIVYYYLTILTGIYFAYNLDPIIEENDKNKLITILNKYVVPYKRKLNNQWISINNTAFGNLKKEKEELIKGSKESFYSDIDLK